MPRNSSVSIPAVLYLAGKLPTGCVICRRAPRELEVWGADISEHYAIYLSAAGDGVADVIYLGTRDFAASTGEGKQWLG